jgi:hypothetical protein
MRNSFALQDIQEHRVEAGVGIYGVNFQVGKILGSLPDVFAAARIATKIALMPHKQSQKMILF